MEVRHKAHCNGRNPFHTTRYLMRLIELIPSQANAIKAQAEKIKELTEENKAQSIAFKLTIETQGEKIKELTEESKAQSNAITAQTEKIEAQNTEVATLRYKLADAEKKLRELNTEKDDLSLSKRILLHSTDDVLRLVTSHTTEIQTLRNDLSHLQSGLAAGGSGSTYVRWGRTTCPTNGTELVYSGFSGGSHYSETGAASNYICLSSNPLWGNYSDAHDAYATVWGGEYQLDGVPNMVSYVGHNLQNEDAPCSVCRSNRPSMIMIPGRNRCYDGWTREYKGYLVAGYTGHAAAGEFVCLDDQPEVLQGGHPNENGKLFYFVEGRCGSLPCPPYVDGREITCVVCTK